MCHINRYITAISLGFNSGLIYAFLGSTLTAYLDDHQISLVLIGLLSWRMFPYSLKPLWAPIVDNLHIKLFRRSFGQRKTWLISAQCMLIVCLVILGLIDVSSYFLLFLCVTVLTSFVAATSDIALEGYRIELFKGASINKGSSFNILGFRVGLFVSGALGLYLAALYPWHVVFLLMAVFLVPGVLIISLSKDNRFLENEATKIKFKVWIKQNFTEALTTLFKLDKIAYVILLLGFYKVSDGYLDTMLLPFLNDIGFNKSEVAYAKTVGIITGVVGNFVGVKVINKLGMGWSLLGAEALASITNLLFLLLIAWSNNNGLLYTINAVESFCGGICNITLMSYMCSMCTNKRFTASHFAILTSVSIIFRTLLSGTSGWIVMEAGWKYFFIISSALSFPSIICVYFLFFKNKKNIS
ncbi:MAG: MFS transporter [Rickettsiales bacterium]|nr:MFS transporter [Rickettsiales bacterium]